MTTFAELLRNHRVARSLTQEQLAERAEVTAKAVGALERGERRRPYPHTVQALATALGLDEDERAGFQAAVPFRIAPRRPARVTTSGRAVVDRTIPTLASRASLSGPVIGRDTDVATVGGLLRAASRRLVTLTGPGGVGKTTVALMAAAGVQANFSGGVVVVELADVVRGDGVMPAIGNALGVPEAGFDGTGSALVPYVTERRLLLVLDNVEHVLSCGPELAALVGACPDLVVLTTSRAPLRVRGEQQVPIAPLSTDDAVRLFQDRVAAAGASLDGSDRTAQAVAALCEWADGLPLAVELAASAAARLGPAVLLARTDMLSSAPPRDLPYRQRSTAATLNWSLDLVGATAGSLLARLSVCAGSFSLAVAEGVGNDQPGGVLAALSELVEHSLVTRMPDVEGTERFRLLEPVRQHAAARLDAAERAAARAGLARVVLDTARSLSDDLRGPGQRVALRLLEADLGNLRVGVEQLLDEGRADQAAELLWLVWYFLAIRGHAHEGSTWAQRLQGRSLSSLGRARWLVAWGCLNFVTSDLTQMRRLLADGLASAQRAGDDALSAEAAVWAAAGAAFGHDLSAAEELLGQAEHYAALADDAFAAGYVRVTRGQVALRSGRVDDAYHILRDAEVSMRATGIPFAVASTLNVRAMTCGVAERHVEAATLLAEAAELAVSSADSWSLSYLIPVLAEVAVSLGDPTRAAWLFGASASYTAQYAVAVNIPAAETLADRGLAATRASLAPDAFDEAWRSGREATMDDIVEQAHAIRRRADS